MAAAAAAAAYFTGRQCQGRSGSRATRFGQRFPVRPTFNWIPGPGDLFVRPPFNGRPPLKGERDVTPGNDPVSRKPRNNLRHLPKSPLVLLD